MKKIIVVGVGAQGSTIAKRMNEHLNISEIICADYDRKAAEELSNSLEKANALQLDAGDLNNVIAAAEGCDLIVNGLPLEYNMIIMEAALAVNAAYMDMAGPMEAIGFVESFQLTARKPFLEMLEATSIRNFSDQWRRCIPEELQRNSSGLTPYSISLRPPN